MRKSLVASLLVLVLAAIAWAVVAFRLVALSGPQLDARAEAGYVRIVPTSHGEPVGIVRIAIVEVMGGVTVYDMVADPPVLANGFNLRPGPNPVALGAGAPLVVYVPKGEDSFRLRRSVLYRVQVCAKTGRIGSGCASTDIKYGTSLVH